jgi:PAS domain S-box-containing protein
MGRAISIYISAESQAEHVQRLDELCQLHGFGLVQAREDAGARSALGSLSAGDEPVLVILDERLAHPIREARAVHAVAPGTFKLFLAADQTERRLRQQLMPISMIGGEFGFADPTSSSFDKALADFFSVAKQRWLFRITLARANVMLTTPATEDRGAFNRLVVSDHFLANILENAYDVIVSTDADGRVASWNRAAQHIFEVAPHVALHRQAADLLEPEGDKVRAALGKVLLTGEPVRDEWSFQKHGKILHMEGLFAGLKNEQGRLISVSIIARDVTAQREAERRLREINKELEERVRERTADLEAAYKELEGFTYSIAHDIRSPVRAVVAKSRILLEDYSESLDGDAIELLQGQARAATHLGCLIDDLLDFARLGRTEMLNSEVDLTGICLSVIEEAASRHSRQVDAQVEPGLRVSGDPQMLRLAIGNLVDNAIKYTPSGSKPQIKIGAQRRKEATVYYISDKGIGFDPSFSHKLFIPFERLHHLDEYPGTGIGLANVQRIVHRHGGRIWAESQIGKGATLYFTLGTNS